MDENKINKDDNRVMRAMISTATADDYDFEAVAVPVENGQVNYSFENNEYFMQILRADNQSVNTERLEFGLPLFDNHPGDASARNQLGITVGYEFEERGLVIRGKFGARADQALKDDINNGILRSVSIEGFINDYEIVRSADELPKYYAKRWTPISLSFAPVPNDIGAKIEIKRAIQRQIAESKPKTDSFFKSLTKKFL